MHKYERENLVSALVVLIIGLVVGILVGYWITMHHRPEVTQWATHSSGHGPIVWMPARVEWNGSEYDVDTFHPIRRDK